MKRIFTFVLVLVAISSSSFSETVDHSNLNSALSEIDQSFNIEGHKVLPQVIHTMWESKIEQVNLLAEQKDRTKYDPVTEDKDGASFQYRNKEDKTYFGGFSYSRIGKLPQGIHLLRVSNNEGGTLTTTDLLVVKAKIKKNF